jgi:hypothetical protein
VACCLVWIRSFVRISRMLRKGLEGSAAASHSLSILPIHCQRKWCVMPLAFVRLEGGTIHSAKLTFLF